MEKKTPNQVIISHDIMRYKKNKWAQMLALLGLVFNCLYFMLLYAYTHDHFRTITIGFSVILTLVVLLTVFLSSENVKNYNRVYSYVLLVVAAFQILRIFGYPLYGLNHKILTAGYFGFYPTADQSWVEFVILLVYLLASAACLVASAVIGWIQATRLQKYMKKVEAGEIEIMDVVKAMDAEDAANAIKVVSDPVLDEALKETEDEAEASEGEV